MLYEFTGFRLDPSQRKLTYQGEPIALTRKAFDTLFLLVQNAGRVLEKDELMRALWPESFVEEGNLSQNIFILRKILGKHLNANLCIQTVPRRGYKFVATVHQLQIPPGSAGSLEHSGLSYQDENASWRQAENLAARKYAVVVKRLRWFAFILAGLLIVATASRWLFPMLAAVAAPKRHWLLLALPYALMIGGLAVALWLLAIIYRQRLNKRLPWFATYVIWDVLTGAAELTTWSISSRLYVAVYWWMEAVSLILILGAMRESFLRIFHGLTEKPGFRWSVRSVIAAVVLYSTWKSVYFPPVQGGRLAAFVIGAEFMFRWGIAGVGILTMVLTSLFKKRLAIVEDAVVTGFTLTSLAFLVSIVNVSLFGTKYYSLTKYAVPAGYFMAVFLWIWAFSRPAKVSPVDGLDPETDKGSPDWNMSLAKY